MEGRHVGLDFYDLLIEALWRCFGNLRECVPTQTDRFPANYFTSRKRIFLMWYFMK